MTERTRPRRPAQNPDDTKRNNEPPIIAGLFVDAGSLYPASDSPTTNARSLRKAFEKVIIWARHNVLKNRHEQGGLHVLQMTTQEKDPPDPAGTPSYVDLDQPGGMGPNHTPDG